MFALVVVLCSGIAGSPAESCDREVVDGPFPTLRECGEAIAQHADRLHVADFQCSRLVRDGHTWGDKPQDPPEYVTPSNP